MKGSPFKYLFVAFIGVLILFYCFNFEVVNYGVRQGKGQLKIILNTQKIADLKADPNTPDSVIEKLNLVSEIKAFCQYQLGLESKDNYTTYYDQKGKPGMYVLSGSSPYKLESYQWEFPFLGQFSYKGYFDRNKGLEALKELSDQGFDADLDEVNAWSTLGWFKDPVMSSMLNLSVGKLARLLIHEITHYNVFVKDDITFNENLASFIGDKGAIAFVKNKYGAGSKELYELHKYLFDLDLFTHHTVLAEELNTFYDTLQALPYRDQSKRKKIDELIGNLLTLPYKGAIRLDHLAASKGKINNVFFTDFLTYKSHYPTLERELKESFNGDIRAFIQHQKQAHGN